MFQACMDWERYEVDAPLRSLYVDFNAYFASVEQQVERRLRGKPVAVVPMLAETTCCIAASYEARAWGIKTGTPVWQARQLCPGLIFIPVRPELYVDYHHRLVAAVEQCLPVDAIRSIDEMQCCLGGVDQQPEQAKALAQKIKGRVRQVGESLRCSIGIAPNAWLAKTASDMQKPDGLIVLQGGDLPLALHRLALRDLCGIGHNMEARLKASGIFTVAQLTSARRETLRQIWHGLPGERLHDLLRGRDVPRQEAKDKQSISHSHVLPPELRHPLGVLGVLHRLLQKAAIRMRHHGLMAQGFAFRVKFLGRKGGQRWKVEHVLAPTDSTLVLTRLLEADWSERPLWTHHMTPLAVSIVLGPLVERHLITPDLFAGERNDPRMQLDATIDWVNSQYGKQTLYFGGAHFARQCAPARIAFNHIPDDEYHCEPD